MTKVNDKNWYKQGIALLVFCLVLGAVMSQLDLFSAFNQNWIDRDIRENGATGALYFVLIACAITACGAPRQMVAFLGGYAFGFVSGTILATLAALLGCMLAFYTSKLLIRPLVRRKFRQQADKINAFLQQQPTRKTIIIRLLPLGSNIVTNLMAGTTSVKPSAFFTGSAIGYLPQMMVFALLGKGLLVGSHWKIGLSVILMLVSSYLSFSLYKKYKNKLEVADNDNSSHIANTRA